MGKKKRSKHRGHRRKTAKRRKSKPRQPPYYWVNRLAECLERFGASFVDLHQFAPDDFKSDRQYEHIERVRARVLVQLIEAITTNDPRLAEQQFADILERANLVDDGPQWFNLEKRLRRGDCKFWAA